MVVLLWKNGTVFAQIWLAFIFFLLLETPAAKSGDPLSVSVKKKTRLFLVFFQGISTYARTHESISISPTIDLLKAVLKKVTVKGERKGCKNE